MTKIKIGLACSLLLLSMLACSWNQFGSRPASGPTSRSVVGVNELRFKDFETGRRFRALDRCIRDRVDNSWQATSYQLLGNFYESHWCRGDGLRQDCQVTDSTRDNRDQNALELYTLFYDQTYPEVFGLGLHSLWVPRSTGWGALYYFAENGQGIVGQGWGVTFREYITPTGQPAATVSLGWSYRYEVSLPARATFEQSSDLPLREDLALYLSSPAAMRDRGLAQNQALAQKVTTGLRAHQVTTCDFGPYQGNGIQPACTPRPLTPEEEAKELARAEAYFAEQEQLLRTYYQEMYAAWMMAFPLNQCWP